MALVCYYFKNPTMVNPMLPSIKIVFQSADFMIISKPAGISFHSEHGEAGFFSQLRQVFQEEHLFAVHRLDKVTSGLLIVAKNKESAAIFSQKFREKAMEKYYLAISDGKPKKKQGLISGDMIRSRRGSWKLLKTRNSPAVTQFFSKSIGAGKRLYLLKPHTGKTHQIRVALKSISAPVLGDQLYYNKAVIDTQRAYLHAYSLNFSWNNRALQFTDIPVDGELFQGDVFMNLITTEYASPEVLSWPKIKTHKYE